MTLPVPSSTRRFVPRGTIALAAAVVVLAGCVGATTKSLIGVRKVSLSLAFADEALKVPVPPRVIVQFVPAPPEAIALAVPETVPFLPPVNSPPQKVTIPTSLLACPVAPAGAVVPEPVPIAITKPPVAGTYLQRNTGTIKLTGGAIPISLPYPPFSKVVIRDVKTEDVPDLYRGSVRKTTFFVEDQLLPTLKIVSHYSYDFDSLDLLQRDVVNDGAITYFKPSPAVQVLAFSGPGGAWNGVGIDTATSNALTVQGKIEKAEAVDICGKLVDTLRTSTDERQVDAKTGTTAGTKAQMPNITNYAMQFGALPVRREQHTTQVVDTGNGKLVFDTDVVSRLTTTEPLPPGTLP